MSSGYPSGHQGQHGHNFQPVPHLPPPQQDALSNYKLDRRIGSGVYCDVYKAINRHTRETVAVKVFKLHQMTNGLSRIDVTREIELLRALSHPNVVRLLQSFTDAGQIYVILEYCNAGDLSKVIQYAHRNRVGLSRAKIWAFFRQITYGLCHLHESRIMHRDLKPANILVNRDGTLKLADLGLGLLLSASGEYARTLLGTPYYMAPERLHQRVYDFSADIWSLACILYEMCTLFTPFYEPDQSIQQLIEKIERLDYVRLKPEVTDPLMLRIVNESLLLQAGSRMPLVVIRQICEASKAEFP